MDHKELGATSSVSTNVSDGSTKFSLSSPTVQSSRNKLYDVGSNSLGKVDTTAARPCAIIGPDRVLPPNPDDTMYLKKVPGEPWPPAENIYRRPPEYPSKVSEYQPTRNISPRQTFQENMQRIMVPPTFSSMKSSDESNLKNTKLNMPQEAKYCDVPYNLNSVNSDHKSVRNLEIQMSNVNPSYARNMPPPYGWPGNVNVRPLRPYGAPEFYQYQEFPSCAGPRPMTLIRPHRPLHEESTPVYSERLYQDANIRFKPYPTGKEKQQQPRYDYISNYPNTFHPPASLPSHKYEVQKTIHGHPYQVYPSVPFKYLDRRIHEPFVDSYHRTLNQHSNFNTFHNQLVPPSYGPLAGNCMQSKTYSNASSKSMNVNKMQFENNNKVYHNLESRNQNYPAPENLYYNETNPSMRGEILLPTHSTVNIHPVPQHSIYRKDNTPLKSYDYNPNYRMFDHVNHSLQRLPLQFSPNTISPSDSNTSNDTLHTIGTSPEDCGYVSQSSTASIRSLDSGNIPLSHQDIYRRANYNNYDMFRNTFHTNGPIQNSKNNNSPSNKKNLDVRQFLQMWNEGDEEVNESNREAAAQNHAKKINSQEQLYVLGLVNVPSEELGKYDHIQKISKLPENIKGYNSLEILNQYEELLETPHVNNYSKSREYNTFSKSLSDKGIANKLPRPVSPLDVEAKISQSVIHKEVGCNFEIKPCSPEMLNVELAAPVQNILGERMIEKVVNRITTKSPNITRSENNKLQNTVNDEIKVTSCKMMSDQYSAKNSSNRIKTRDYSMQDLESNAGLCLASLPQLDNDIELNFPEINQQFIKANQIESNITPAVQNLLNVDLDQTHNFLPHEIKNDSQQNNLCPQLASAGDKECSKLSKYRKGKKCEPTSSHSILKQDAIKSNESIAVLQRIDSVIIKNPDTIKSHFNDSIKIINDSNHDMIYQEEPKQSDASLKYEQNDDNLPSETAIDFSLTRSEDETAARYLNSIHRNQNLPQLEAFDESGLNNNISITSGCKIQDVLGTVSSLSSTVVVDEPQIDSLQLKVTEEFGNNKQSESQEIIENKYDTVLKVPVKSHEISDVNEKNNVLVTGKTETGELGIPEIHENETNSDIKKNTESPVLNITNVNSVCEELIEGNIFPNPSDTTVHSIYKIDIKKDETAADGQYNLAKFANRKQNSIISNMVSEMPFDVKSYNAYFENSYDIDLTPKQTIQDVLENLSNQDNDNSNHESDMSQHSVESEITKFSIVSDNSQRKNEEIAENESSILFASEIDKETIGVVLEQDATTETYSLVSSVPNARDITLDVNEELAGVVSQQNSEKHLINTPDIMSTSLERIDYVKTETNLKMAECNEETVSKSTEVILKQDNKIKIEASKFEYLSEDNINNINECDFSISSVTPETKHESSQKDIVRKLNTSNVECLSNESDANMCDVENETSYHRDDTKSIATSTIELVELKQELKITSFATILEKNLETDMNVGESECGSSKIESHANTVVVPYSVVNKAALENPHVIIDKCTHDMDIDNYLKTNYDTIIDAVEPECLSGKFCIESTSVEDSDICKRNINSVDEPSVRNSELGHETVIDIGQPNVLASKSDVNFIETSNSTSHNKLTVENVYNKHEIEMDNIAQQNLESNADKTESSCLTERIKNLEEPLVTISKETTPENFIVKATEFSQIIGSKNNDPITEEKLDIHNLGIDPAPSHSSEHEDNTSEDENKLLHIEDKNLPSWKCQTLLKINETRNKRVSVKKEPMYFRKELFSPRFQKLLVFSEGFCKSIKNKNLAREDNCGKDNTDYLVNQNDEVATNKCNENQLVKQDSANLNDKYKSIKNFSYKISPAVNQNSTVIEPRKISKRSLSESALEAYKNNDDIHLVQPCKRRKGIIGEKNILDSHMISEDICNIIQTNRRNSISTFYNEDNVYIVIDNDLILAEEHDGADKICFTDSTEEFLTSIESINCEINLNIETDSFTDEQNQICEFSDSLQHIEEKSTEDSWVADVACIETVFSDDVAENIIIDVQPSPKKVNFSDLESVDEESTVFYDNDHHIDKIKSIYGRNMYNDNSELIETLYRTPQMNVNKTLYHIESQDPNEKECIDDFIENCLESNDCSAISENGISAYKVVGNKENMSENLSLNSKQCNHNIYVNIDHNNDFKFKEFASEKLEEQTTQSWESSNNHLTPTVKENSTYSGSSSPEVSSTTSEEKNSSILLKITNCNGARSSQINEVSTDSRNKLSYKLTEKGEYQSYNSNFSSARTLITKAAQKYIPPLKETVYDLKVKLPLPQHRLHTLKQLKIAKLEPKVATANMCSVKNLNYDKNKKQKPKFEDVLKSIDEINFKRHKDNIKKGKISIPKVIIKKNENGAHYASSKTTNSKKTYNPDLTGCKWQPWVFLEKNNFVDGMALQNKAKAVFCRRKNNYVLLEKFRKYKSVYNANFVISQPKSTKGNLKYTIRLKNIN